MSEMLDHESSQDLVIVKETSDAILQRLDWMLMQPKKILVLDQFSNLLKSEFQKKYPQVEILSESNDADMLCANLILPWQQNLAAVLKAWKQCIKSEGIVMFSAFGPDTLKEWGGEFQNSSCVHLIDMHDLGDALVQAGFCDPVLDVEYFTLNYRNKKQFLDELKAMKILHKDAVTELEEETYPATFEMIYVHAWVPDAETFTANEDGVTKVPLNYLREKLRG